MVPFVFQWAGCTRSSFGAVSEQFQCSFSSAPVQHFHSSIFRAVCLRYLGQFSMAIQGSIRAVLEQLQGSFRAVLEQLQGSFRAVLVTSLSNFRAVSYASVVSSTGCTQSSFRAFSARPQCDIRALSEQFAGAICAIFHWRFRALFEQFQNSSSANFM